MNSGRADCPRSPPRRAHQTCLLLILAAALCGGQFPHTFDQIVADSGQNACLGRVFCHAFALGRGIRYLASNKRRGETAAKDANVNGCRRMLRSRKQCAGVFKCPVTHHDLHQLVSLGRLRFWLLYENLNNLRKIKNSAASLGDDE